jgi:hypothetical protein
MKNLIPALSLSLLGCAILVYSCQKESNVPAASDPSAAHQTKIYLTDHQTPVFDSIFVDIRKLEVRVQDDSIPGDHWVNIGIRAGVYNILRFRNGLDTLFGTGGLPNARLKEIRLTLGTQNSVMKDGVISALRLHDDDRTVRAQLDDNSFEISPTGDVLFWIDFDASRSIQVDNSGSGNNNGYRLRSHISIFTRSHSGSIEGRVLPVAADAIVMAVRGTDTTMAVPNDDRGEFKIVGLTAGSYKIIVDGQLPYQDTIINNVIVVNREDTHLPTITLHQ